MPSIALATCIGAQLVGLMMKSRPVDVDVDVADVHDDPFDDVRDRVGARGVYFGLGGDGVDLQARSGSRRCRGRTGRRPRW